MTGNEYKFATVNSLILLFFFDSPLTNVKQTEIQVYT